MNPGKGARAHHKSAAGFIYFGYACVLYPACSTARRIARAVADPRKGRGGSCPAVTA
jgi:hypothetical protein